MLSLIKIDSSTPTSSAARVPSRADDTYTPTDSMSSAVHIQEPTRPARAVSRTYPAVPLSDTGDAVLRRPASTKAFDAGDLERSRPVTPVEVVELDEGGDDHHNSADGDDSANDPHMPRSDASDAFGTAGDEAAVEVLQSVFAPRKNVFRMAAVALITLNDGLHDSAAGALLPYIEQQYGIGYGIVSLIFVASAFGAIMAATVADPMKRRLGRARTLCLAQLMMAVGYVPMLASQRAPFPAVVVGFFVVGLGEAINVAIGNTFCASLRQTTLALGIMHGSYGIGGISGPLVATAVVVASGGVLSSAGGSHVDASSSSSSATSPVKAVFGRYYFLPFGVCVLTAAFAAWSFTGYEKDSGENAEEEASASASSSSSPAPRSEASRAERRRRWNLGRLRQEQFQQEQRQQQASDRQHSWDAKASDPGIQMTDFGAGARASVQRPPAASQPSTAGSSRANSRAASPARTCRPVLAPLQSVPPTADPTPAHSFMSAAPLVPSSDGVDARRPAPAMSRQNHHDDGGNRGWRPALSRRRHRAATRLYDMFTAPSARVVLLGALFLFMYQGAEVSIAGWVTSFLMADRGSSEPAVGYITAGFWAGITVGRFALAVPAQRVGARRFVYGVVVGAAVFELLVWFVPNVISNAVSVAIVGLLIGPVYPCAAGIFMRSLSRRERIAGMSTMTAFGSAGGAAAPFVTGMLAQVAGPYVLHPIVIGLFAAMLGFWYLIPAPKKPTE